jgi:hydrogenase maturation protease
VTAPTVVVAGFGSQYHCDDGVGPRVADEVIARSHDVRNVGPLGDPLDLLGLWNHADLVVVIDAVRSSESPGTIHTIELDLSSSASAVEGEESDTTSSHGIGLTGVARLARAIGQAPNRLVLVGIEGERFEFGEGLSPAVAGAVPDAVRQVLALIEEVQTCA